MTFSLDSSSSSLSPGLVAKYFHFQRDRKSLKMKRDEIERMERNWLFKERELSNIYPLHATHNHQRLWVITLLLSNLRLVHTSDEVAVMRIKTVESVELEDRAEGGQLEAWRKSLMIAHLFEFEEDESTWYQYFILGSKRARQKLYRIANTLAYKQNCYARSAR